MKRDITMIPGDRDRPAAVFIHGLGMDKRIWEEVAGFVWTAESSF
jgi:hypothetical protein